MSQPTTPKVTPFDVLDEYFQEKGQQIVKTNEATTILKERLGISQSTAEREFKKYHQSRNIESVMKGKWRMSLSDKAV